MNIRSADSNPTAVICMHKALNPKTLNPNYGLATEVDLLHGRPMVVRCDTVSLVVGIPQFEDRQNVGLDR